MVYVMNKKIIPATILLSVFAVGLASGVLGASKYDEISAYLNKEVQLILKNEKWEPKDENGTAIFPITYNGSTYLPVRAVGEALGVTIDWDEPSNSVLINSTIKPTPNTVSNIQPIEQLQSINEIKEYLTSTYASPLATDIGDIQFRFDISENKSKYEQYDILINFDYEVQEIDHKLFELESSIDSADVEKAKKVTAQIQSFIETFANDAITRAPNKKIKGHSDGSYYKYPNIKEGYVNFVRFMWVNYDFVDPKSIFADYYSNLATYNETAISSFKWAPKKH